MHRAAIGRYIFLMLHRGLCVLLLAVGLLLAGLALVPAGCGPYSVVYGPATALRAQRAFLFLTLVWFALAAMAPVAILVRRWSVLLRIPFAESWADIFFLPVQLSGLRC